MKAKKIKIDSDTSLAEKAYRQIENMIVTAELAPAEWISEKSLSARIGIGRTPVREAIKRLVDNHLIEVQAGRGWRITQINVGEQLLVLELRREIERLLVGRAAQRASSDDRKEFLAIAGQIADAAKHRRAHEYYDLDLKYKMLLYRAAANPYAAAAIGPLHAISRRFAWVHRDNWDVSKTGSWVIDIAKTIAAGKSEAAQRHCDRMMDALVKLSRDTLNRL